MAVVDGRPSMPGRQGRMAARVGRGNRESSRPSVLGRQGKTATHICWGSKGGRPPLYVGRTAAHIWWGGKCRKLSKHTREAVPRAALTCFGNQQMAIQAYWEGNMGSHSDLLGRQWEATRTAALSCWGTNVHGRPSMLGTWDGQPP